MKKFLKTLSIALAILLLIPLTMGIPASAAYDDGTITIHKSQAGNVLLTGQTFDAYKLFSVTYSEDKQHYAYILNPSFAGFTNYPNSGSQTLLQYIEPQITDSEAMDDLATALWEYIDAQNISPAKSVTASGPDSVTFTGMEYGYYLVYGSGVGPDGKKVVAACSLSTTDPDADVHLKADVPTLTKKVWNDNTAPGKWDTWADVNIGDKVDFQLTSNVPIMRGYDRYDYIVHDKMSRGLTFDATSVVVEIAGTRLTLNTHYTVTSSIVGGETLVDIKMDLKALVAAKTIEEGEDIFITFSATLNGEAVIGAPGNPNEARLEYSNDPYDTSSTEETPPSTVIVYTFDVRGGIMKYWKDKQGNERPLANAVFELRKTANDPNSAILFTKVSTDPTLNARYRPAVAPETGDSKLISPSNGWFNISGLDAGTYYLVEITAPDGFYPLEAPVTIVISHTLGTDGVGTGQYQVIADGEISTCIHVLNSSGTRFPETGGVGRTIFIVVGLLLMFGAATVLIFRKKVRNAR